MVLLSVYYTLPRDSECYHAFGLIIIFVKDVDLDGRQSTQFSELPRFSKFAVCDICRNYST